MAPSGNLDMDTYDTVFSMLQGNESLKSDREPSENHDPRLRNFLHITATAVFHQSSPQHCLHPYSNITRTILMLRRSPDLLEIGTAQLTYLPNRRVFANMSR